MTPLVATPRQLRHAQLFAHSQKATASLSPATTCSFTGNRHAGPWDRTSRSADEDLRYDQIGAIRSRIGVTPAIMLGWTLQRSWLRKSSTPSGWVETSGCLI